MAIDWTPDCREVLRSARALSKQLGHHEIVTLCHVFCALLPHIYDVDLDHVTKVVAADFPPWDDGAVYLSPGGQTPSLKRALDQAMNFAESEQRQVTPQDIWNSLPHGDAETVKHLLNLFSLHE